jgi:hypothetical protein
MAFPSEVDHEASCATVDDTAAVLDDLTLFFEFLRRAFRGRQTSKTLASELGERGRSRLHTKASSTRLNVLSSTRASSSGSQAVARAIAAAATSATIE